MLMNRICSFLDRTPKALHFPALEFGWELSNATGLTSSKTPSVTLPTPQPAFHPPVTSQPVLVPPPPPPGGVEPDFILLSCSGAPRAGLDAAELQKLVAAKRRGEDHLRASGLGYTIIRPGPLVDEPGGYKALVFDQGDRVTQVTAGCRALGKP